MIDIMKNSDNMPETNKEYLAENIDYGVCLYSEVPEELKNPDSWKYIYYLDEQCFCKVRLRRFEYSTHRTTVKNICTAMGMVYMRTVFWQT